MKLTQISDFKIGRSIQGFYLCKEKYLRYTRNDDLYLGLGCKAVINLPLFIIYGLADTIH